MNSHHQAHRSLLAFLVACTVLMTACYNRGTGGVSNRGNHGGYCDFAANLAVSGNPSQGYVLSGTVTATAKYGSSVACTASTTITMTNDATWSYSVTRPTSHPTPARSVFIARRIPKDVFMSSASGRWSVDYYGQTTRGTFPIRMSFV